MTAHAKTPGKPRVRKSPVVANATRGEHTITLAGVTYLLRPTMAAVSNIETALDMSLIEILRKANMCALKLDEIGTVLREFIIAGASDEITRTVSSERLAELCMENGQGAIFAALVLILADVISGGRDTEGNVKAGLAHRS